MPAGTLNITVVSCRELKKAQQVGRQDPYVVVEAGGSQLRTKTDTDGGTKPKWNQKFEISIGPDVNEVKFSVWNDNVAHTNDLIATGRLTLNTVFNQGFHDARVELTTQDGKCAGQLLILATFQHIVAAVQPALCPVTQTGTATGGELTVQILRGSGLKDVETAGQRQDPYCVLQIGSTKFKTKTVTDGGKNPKFDERFNFSIGPQDTQLSIEMWDANVVRTDRMIGSGRLSLTEALTKNFHEARLQLMDQKNVSAGEIELFLTFKPFGTAATVTMPVLQQPVLQQPVLQQPVVVQNPAVTPVSAAPIAAAVQPTAVQSTAVQPTAVQPVAIIQQQMQQPMAVHTTPMPTPAIAVHPQQQPAVQTPAIVQPVSGIQQVVQPQVQPQVVQPQMVQPAAPVVQSPPMVVQSVALPVVQQQPPVQHPPVVPHLPPQPQPVVLPNATMPMAAPQAPLSQGPPLYPPQPESYPMLAQPPATLPPLHIAAPYTPSYTPQAQPNAVFQNPNPSAPFGCNNGNSGYPTIHYSEGGQYPLVIPSSFENNHNQFTTAAPPLSYDAFGPVSI